MTTFVLIAGAWHSGWCWERVTPFLEAAGHRAVTPDLLGMGRDTTPLSMVTLSGWADQIADLVRVQPEAVVLVGHSRGGIVISETAERVPDRIRKLVYVTAVLIPNGVTLATFMSHGNGEPINMCIGTDGTSMVSRHAVSGRFYNKTITEWVERAAARLSPEPMIVFQTPLSLTSTGYGRVPRAYIECTNDLALDITDQRAMQAQLPCSPVITLDSDHSPFYSMPERLAAALISLT